MMVRCMFAVACAAIGFSALGCESIVFVEMHSDDLQGSTMFDGITDGACRGGVR